MFRSRGSVRHFETFQKLYKATSSVLENKEFNHF